MALSVSGAIQHRKENLSFVLKNWNRKHFNKNDIVHKFCIGRTAVSIIVQNLSWFIG